MLEPDPVATEKSALLPKDRQALGFICKYIIFQCILVFVGASTIYHCLWSPENATEDIDKLIRIMYLFDSHACGYNLRASRAISNLQLSNYTDGRAVLPITWTPAIMTVSTRLTAKTRKYIELSIIFHVFWLLIAIAFDFMRSTTNVRILKLSLFMLLYSIVFVITFDLSMAIVYIAHIQKSLTNGMILRYSGWSVEMKLTNYESFGGWLPIAASICWMRGIVFLVLNIYAARKVRLVRRRIRKGEMKKKLMMEENPPIPEAKYKEPMDDKVLYFRTGEKKPYLRQPYRMF